MPNVVVTYRKESTLDRYVVMVNVKGHPQAIDVATVGCEYNVRQVDKNLGQELAEVVRRHLEERFNDPTKLIEIR